MDLRFNPNGYEIQTLDNEDLHFQYRAYTGIPYVTYPIAKDLQVLNIFVPEDYYRNQDTNGYNLHSAPIFMPNSVGGYKPGKCKEPGIDSKGQPNTIAKALLHGYVVVSPGLRGRGMKNEAGENIGVAPADICDYKAAVRYLRHNKEIIPGNTDRIISNGTSAGGAMSALLGSTGNHKDYEPYLEEMGAAHESDAIFAASCYCPITNLEHADMAYEWEFSGLWDYHKKKYKKTDNGKLEIVSKDGIMTDEQRKMSVQLKECFPRYIESLGFTDMDEIKEYIVKHVKQSAQAALNQGEDMSVYPWITIENDVITDIDYSEYIKYRSRMKATPAFDSVELTTPENELFGSSDEPFRHFTEFSYARSEVNGKMAEQKQIKMMNPMYYIDDCSADTARYFRIRHGCVDCDTSLYIPTILALKLMNCGVNVDFALPWNMWHSGDYDLEELFAWIDGICNATSSCKNSN